MSAAPGSTAIAPPETSGCERVRHFALNLVRAANDKHSSKLRQKLATWTPACLENLLNAGTN